MITATRPKASVRRAQLTVVAVLAALAAGMSVAGCSSAPKQGTLEGTLQAVGGPAGAASRPLSGYVTLHGSNGNIATIDLSDNGRFSVHVPVGRYTVAGRSPHFDGGAGECTTPQSVTVTDKGTSRVRVDCLES
jgi:hypothetical protein